MSRLLYPHEVASQLKVRIAHVRNLIKLGKIPAVDVKSPKAHRSRWRIDPDALAAAMESWSKPANEIVVAGAKPRKRRGPQEPVTEYFE